MFRIISTALLVLVTSIANASWTVQDSHDLVSAQTIKAAVTTNKDGYSLAVYRRADGRVWVQFALPKGSKDKLDATIPPVMKVDLNDANDLSASKKVQETTGFETYEWNPNSVSYSIWHGKESEGRNQRINELLSGHTMVVKYSAFGDGIKDVTIPLDGAGAAIAAAIGISADVDKDKEARIEAYNKLSSFAFGVCTKKRPGSDMRDCLSSLQDCSKKTTETKDTDALRECLKEARLINSIQ